MDFAFTPEQQALKDSARRLAEKRIAPIAEEADESADGASRADGHTGRVGDAALHRARGLRRLRRAGDEPVHHPRGTGPGLGPG